MKGTRVKTGGMSMGSSTRMGMTNSPPGKQKRREEISVRSGKLFAAHTESIAHDQVEQSKKF